MRAHAFIVRVYPYFRQSVRVKGEVNGKVKGRDKGIE